MTRQVIRKTDCRMYYNKIMTQTISKTNTARPFLKWVGGKARLVPEISKYLPEEYTNYFEPFVGGGAMFFAINPKTAYINDLNGVLISLYLNIKSDVERVIDSLSELEKQYCNLNSLEDKKALYLRQRELFNSLPNDSFDKSVLLIFLKL